MLMMQSNWKLPDWLPGDIFLLGWILQRVELWDHSPSIAPGDHSPRLKFSSCRAYGNQWNWAEVRTDCFKNTLLLLVVGEGVGVGGVSRQTKILIRGLVLFLSHTVTLHLLSSTDTIFICWGSGMACLSISNVQFGFLWFVSYLSVPHPSSPHSFLLFFLPFHLSIVLELSEAA